MKINQTSKDIVVDSYVPYSRDADPHLKKYLERKQKISDNRHNSVQKKDYFANVRSQANYPTFSHGEKPGAGGRKQREFVTRLSPKPTS